MPAKKLGAYSNPKAGHLINRRVVGRAKCLRVVAMTPKPGRKKERGEKREEGGGRRERTDLARITKASVANIIKRVVLRGERVRGREGGKEGKRKRKRRERREKREERREMRDERRGKEVEGRKNHYRN